MITDTFTVTITCTTRRPIVITLLQQAMQNPAERFKMLRRFEAAIGKTATALGGAEMWGVTVADITAAHSAPEGVE